MSIYKMRTEFGKYLKPILFLIAFVFLVGAIYSFGTAPTSDKKKKESEEKVLATVNGSKITQAEFDSAWYQRTKGPDSKNINSTLQLAEIRAGIFQQLVSSRLLVSAAARMGYRITDDNVRQEREQFVIEYLKQNRRLVLGKISKKQEALDPRDDSRYKSALAKNEMSLNGFIETAEMMVPAEQVRAQLAEKAVTDAIKKKVGKVTDKDIKESYDTYKLRQIVLRKGQLPEEQLTNKSEKILKQAKDGASFAKLAKDNSEGPNKDAGGQVEYSLDQSWMVPPEVADAVKELKPGGITDVIDTDFALYIAKLESVENKMPEELDDKAKEERKKMITQFRQMQATGEFYKSLFENAKIRVEDPEMRGYWYEFESMRAQANPEESKKHRDLAISAYKRAIDERPNLDFATVRLALLMEQDGKTKEAIKLLYPIIEGERSTARGADLHLKYGGLLLDDGQNDQALAAFKRAGEAAIADRYIHQQLVMRYQQLERPDLVEIEQEWIKDYDERMKQWQEVQEKDKQKKESETKE